MDDVHAKDEQKQKRRLRRKLTGAAAGTVAAASIAAASLFGSPAELLAVENDDEDAQQPDAAIVSVGKRASASAAGERAERRSPADRLRAFILRQPAVVRAVFLLPLWGAGQGLIALLTGTLAPLWQGLLSMLLSALLIFGVFLLAYKLLFPNKSIKALLTGKGLPWLIGGCLLLAVADGACRLWLADYETISAVVKACLALLVFSLLCWRVFGPRRKSAAVRAA